MFLIVFVVSGLLQVNGYFYEPKNNLTNLSHCKVEYTRSGSVYRTFYELADSVSEHDDTLLLDFHFAVLTPSDAHILLAPSETVDTDDPVYEIVIGAGGNTFSDIRRRKKSDVKASVRIKGLLDGLDPRFFWLHISKDGVIDVGKEGEQLPFITWTDPDPLPLKVISFSTWSGIEAKWYFDCQWQNETKEIEKNLTYTEKLRRDLLYHYDPYVRPVMNIWTITSVSLAFQINHVSLNEHKGSVQIYGVTKMAWHDEKLRWDPTEYGDIETLHIFRREIWQPDLVLLNSIGDGRDILRDSLMVAHSSGLVEWNPAINLEAWTDAEEIGTWPSDVHKCNLILTFMRDYKHIQLQFNRNESSLIFHDFSEWSVLQADIFSETSVETGPAVIQIVLTIKRSSILYKTIFFTPFLFISVSVLLTFWMDPFGKMKISVCCGQLILSTIMLIALALVAPNHSYRVPYLVSLYSFTLLATLFAIIVAIVVINICRNTKSKPLPHLLCRFLTTKFINVYLQLPKMQTSQDYGKLYQKSQEQIQMMWILFGTAIDRFVFLLFLIMMVYAIVVYK